MRKLIGTVAVGGVAALVIALAGNPGAVETIASASTAHSSAAMMKKSKKCKKGDVKNKKGKCVKKPKPTTTTTTGASTTTTGTSTGTSTGTTTSGTTSAKPTSAEVAAGKTLFEATCSGCHGKTGEGPIAPPYSELPRAQTIKGVVEQLEKPINEKSIKMPEYNSMYTLAEKEEIGAYITVELTKKEKVGGGG